MKKIALFAGIGILLIAITAGATFFITSKSAATTTVKTETKTITVIANPPFEVGPTYTLQTRVVNLGDAIHVLKIQATLAFSPVLDKADTVKSKLTARELIIQDIMTSTLSDMTAEQLLTSQGKDMLKKTLIAKFSPIIPELHLVDIYFPDFYIQ